MNEETQRAMFDWFTKHRGAEVTIRITSGHKISGTVDGVFSHWVRIGPAFVVFASIATMETHVSKSESKQA